MLAALAEWASPSHGDKHWCAASHDAIGNALRHFGRLDEALLETTEGLRLRQEIGFEAGVADSQLNLGNIYYLQGDAEKALEFYESTASYHREHREDDIDGGLARARSMEGLALARLAKMTGLSALIARPSACSPSYGTTAPCRMRGSTWRRPTCRPGSACLPGARLRTPMPLRVRPAKESMPSRRCAS